MLILVILNRFFSRTQRSRVRTYSALIGGKTEYVTALTNTTPFLQDNAPAPVSNFFIPLYRGVLFSRQPFTLFF